MPLDPKGLIVLQPEDLKDGDILVELADLHTLFGRAAYRMSWIDAEKKGVPVCQHTKMVATRNGKRTQIEAIWKVSERPLSVHQNTFIVVRAASASPEQIANAITWSRKRIGQMYGYENLFRLGLHLAWPWLNVKGDDKDPLVCSQLSSEAFEEGARYVEWGDLDAQLMPLDFLTDAVRPHFYIAGRVGR